MHRTYSHTQSTASHQHCEDKICDEMELPVNTRSNQDYKCAQIKGKKTRLLRSIVLPQGLVVLYTNPVAWLEKCRTYKEHQCTGLYRKIYKANNNKAKTTFIFFHKPVSRATSDKMSYSSSPYAFTQANRGEFVHSPTYMTVPSFEGCPATCTLHLLPTEMASAAAFCSSVRAASSAFFFAMSSSLK